MTRLSTLFGGGLLLLAATATPAAAQVVATYPVGTTTLTLSNLATGLNVPWHLEWGPDNFIWMTERVGRVSRIDPATGQVQLVATIADVTQTAESGLLGMALVPNSVAGQPLWVYVVYNYTDGGTVKEKLVRFDYTNGALTNPTTILSNLAGAMYHNGSRVILLPDRTLLMTTGDATNTSFAQDPQNLNGKILRLNLDGTVPANNPTPGSLVYTRGHRNPQGLVQVPATGFVYSSEHGPNNDDEVNKIEAGRNYGWPNVEGFCNLPAEQTFCAANNVREPLMAWTPTLAVSGLAHYNHPAIPEWSNSLLLNSLKAGRFQQLPLSAAGTTINAANPLWNGTYGRLRAICVSPQGKIYIGTSNRDGSGAPGATDDRILVLENRAYSTTATATGQLKKTFTLSPNPASSTATVQFSAPLQAGAELQVHDAMGRAVYRAIVPAGQQQLTLPGQLWRSGMYTVRLASGTQSFTTQRLVLTR
ncbi:T9SS type A sorting domain-containing protein [Hymenobacter busanensis]|uniref:T9SS type A sorting domain-containing protein n=1 Tax=Hymenobacter busanensis TaxID=2607656 RepID=A0A7L5A2V4_9BACT|nr:PQQ-dependent sugar dehydrogenase [Hymenobacter busanensis]KAA9331631.1 T9SS type A sorting domain-containing protein [Hymenobacter busanensis]QHJ08782.1 T9SS type A sorting domain-containing protein [Hymenobacter busanensis]